MLLLTLIPPSLPHPPPLPLFTTAVVPMSYILFTSAEPSGPSDLNLGNDWNDIHAQGTKTYKILCPICST